MVDLSPGTLNTTIWYVLLTLTKEVNMSPKFVIMNIASLMILGNFYFEDGSEDFEYGYLEKSGSKRWIETDQDVDAMYRALKGRSFDITLWCARAKQLIGKKRKSEEIEDPPSKRLSKEETVERLTNELHEKHGDQFSRPQLKLWTRMKLNNQHDNMEHPPQIPLFTGSIVNKPKRESLSEALTSAATAVVGVLKGQSESPIIAPAESSMSPGKRARVSGQYLEHLQVYKSLECYLALNLKSRKGLCLEILRKLTMCDMYCTFYCKYPLH